MANTSNPDIIYTKVDEAPELASASLLPIIQRFASAAGISVGTKDISLAGRILSRFPESLSEAQCIDDHLSELGDIVKTSGANVIKLPNISASVPQLVAAITQKTRQPTPRKKPAHAMTRSRDQRSIQFYGRAIRIGARRQL